MLIFRLTNFLKYVTIGFDKTYCWVMKIMLAEFEKYFLWLMIYSVAGWVYESIICSLDHGKFINRGFLNGPYCPIYGFGALLVLKILGGIENPFFLFVLGAILTCSLEYAVSYVLEKLFGARWWDYSDKKFNINGRVCLLGAVVFGGFSLVLVKVIHPYINALTDMLPATFAHVLTIALLALFTADNIITFVGITGFDKRLKEFSAFLEQKKYEASEKMSKEAFTAAREAFVKKLNYQQKRIIKSFPRLKSVKYNAELSELKEHIKNRIKERKR